MDCIQTEYNEVGMSFLLSLLLSLLLLLQVWLLGCLGQRGYHRFRYYFGFFFYAS